ncbi:MAG: TIGR04086 family membrane protein [Prevotella sp.]|nr:TIGR04086 family membrane protein [Staphylococcus sp.]MCM1349613.1 TIGR04086 family membrane protein [Prevotella sp.]
MQFVKQKAITFLISFFIFILFTLVYTLILYFGKVSYTETSVYRFTFVIGVLSFFIYGFLTGKIEQKHGLLSSFLSTLVILALVVLVHLLSKKSIDAPSWIKYASYLLASSLGGMLGVNFHSIKKKDSKKKKQH